MRSDQSKIFIKDKTKVACRMSGIERRVVYFRKLLFKINNEKKVDKLYDKYSTRHDVGLI